MTNQTDTILYIVSLVQPEHMYLSEIKCNTFGLKN